MTETMTWIHPDDVAPVRHADGITLRRLWHHDNGAKAYVVDIAPGAAWPRLDVHEPGPEEVFVAAGIFHDGEREYPAGTFIHCPAGSSHWPQSRTGCRLFVFYPEG
jgi:quercetin dioxygenase-like cupin family protein